MFLNCIAVGAGGFLGAVSRYLMGMIPFLQKGSLPYHTLLINVLGAVLIGIVVKTADSTEILNPSTVLFLKVGICGGFTTFSTFSLESLDLLQSGRASGLCSICDSKCCAVRRRRAGRKVDCRHFAGIIKRAERGSYMKRETYVSMLSKIRKSPVLYGYVVWSDRILTKISYIIYPLFLLYLMVNKKPELGKAILVPAVSFVVLSIFRYLYNAPRPYEVFDTPSLIRKDTRGKSFPSRHVFSAFVIAVTVFYTCHPLGIFLGICSLLLAVSRVLGGVHFTKDVLAGAVSGILCGMLLFIL